MIQSLAVLVQCWLVIDGRIDGQTDRHDDSIYRTSTALHGKICKNPPLYKMNVLSKGFDAVSCVLICVPTLGIVVVGLVNFHFLISILRVLLILSRLFRTTISVFFVPCCPVILSFNWFYLTRLNEIKINGDPFLHPELSTEIETSAPFTKIRNNSSECFIIVVTGIMITSCSCNVKSIRLLD